MTVDRPRYCPDRALPPYSYVPGLSPHPTSDPRGHSFAAEQRNGEALDESSYTSNETYLYALDLFNHGYYWEAHEEWEQLWHMAGRKGPTADFLKGLIKLAAAGVKLREGRGAGVRQHAERAAELIAGAAGSADEHQSVMFGLRVREISQFAVQLVRNSHNLEGETANASRRLELLLKLVEDSPRQ